MAGVPQETPVWIKKEKTDVVPNEPGSVNLEDPLSSDPGFNIKQDPDVGGCKYNNVEDPLRIDPGFNIKQDPDVDGSKYYNLEDPLSIDPVFNIKQDPDVDGSKYNFLDPLGVYWSTDNVNEDSKLNFGWDENENNNAAVSTLLHTILEAESECCPPLLKVPKKELFPDDTLGISYLTDFIKEEPELNLEADEPENIFLADPLSIEAAGLHLKHDPELNVDGSKKGVSTENALNNQTSPIGIFCDLSKVVASENSASNTTRFTGNIEKCCDVSHDETVNQGTVHSKLEIDSEDSTYFFMSGEEEESLYGTKRKCSLRDSKFYKFTCSFCLQSFPSKYRLIMHVFIHIDGVHPPAFLCKSCGEVFPSCVSLNKHLKICELEQAIYADKGKKYEGSGDHGNIFSEGDQEYTVREQTERQCSSKETWKTTAKSFNGIGNTHTITNNAEIRNMYDNYERSCTSGNVNAHTVARRVKRPQIYNVGGKCIKSNLGKHALTHTETLPHNCDICRKSFTRLGNLKKHSLIHTGTRPHKCDTCGKSFTQLGTLRLHSSIHTGIKPHKCDTCGKSFPRLIALKYHAFIHAERPPHKCVTCGKSFTQLGNLRLHSLIHTGSQPHKCDTCGNSFTQLRSLKQHLLKHTGMTQHKCDTCGKYFHQITGLKQHALIHSRPHKCNICGKSYIHLGDLKKHTLIHTERGPHKCKICGISFSYLCDLKYHTLAHTGIKPHLCNICGKSFSRLAALKRHTLIHTRTKPHKSDIGGKSPTVLGSSRGTQ